MASSSLNLDELIADVQQLRRFIVLASAGTLVLFVTSLLGALSVVGLFVAPTSPVGGTVVSEAMAQVGVVIGSVAATLPLLAVLLAASFVYHRRMPSILGELGLPAPAHGIREGMRFLSLPLVVSGLAALVFVALQVVMPTPDSDDMVGNLVAGLALALGLMIPLPGVVLARVIGTDRVATAAWRAGDYAAVRAVVQRRGLRGWPLVNGRPPGLVLADLLRMDGAFQEAEDLVMEHLMTVGVSPTSSLLLLAQIAGDRGDVQRAEALCAGAARILPVDSRWATQLAALREEAGRRSDADLLRARLGGRLWRGAPA